MKKILYIFIAMLTLWSCGKEVLQNNNQEKAPKGTVEIKMDFPGRSIAKATRAGTYEAADVERAIAQVRIFVFSDKAGKPDKLLISEPVDLKPGNSEAGVIGTFFMRKFGKLHLVATANIPFSEDQKQKMLGIDFSTFSKTLVTQPAGTANAFAMTSDIVTAAIPDPNTNAAVPKISFLLERLSARIDIENETTATDGLFELEEARLYNAIDRSFLVKGQTPALTIGNIEYGALQIPLGDWKVNPGVSGDKKKMYMQMYAYENVANSLHVQIKGKFKGQEAQFSIPFAAKPVKRNTRYVVKIKNVVGNKVIFNIIVKDWENGGEIKLKPGVDTGKPIVKKIEASNASGTVIANNHTYASNSLTLKSSALYHTKITLESASSEATILVNKAEVPWISVKELGKSNISGGKLVQTFLVSYAKTADLYPRTAELEIQNKYLPDKANPILIKVTQPKASTTNNILAKFANANVGELNQFAAVITPNNLTDYEKLGKYYQWGRNVAFTYSGAITTTATKSNGNDAATWGSKFITADRNPHAWYNGNLGNSWTAVVAKATSAPASYKGTNGGDPCPVGYRLPEKDEFSAIMFQSGLRFNGNVNSKGVSEALKLGGAAAASNYTADYYTKTPNVIYGLKMKDTKNDKLIAYRWEYKAAKGLWITSRVLGTAGATTKVEDIANESFWNDAAKGGSDVIRYFPAMGYRSAVNGSPNVRGAYGYFWSSVESSASYAWDLYFSGGYGGVYSNYKAYAFTVRPFSRN